MKKILSINSKFLTSIAIFFCLLSCDSFITTKEIANPENISCYISITQDRTDKKQNNGIIALYDKNDNNIANDSVYVIVNDSVLHLTAGDHWMGRANRYIFENIPLVNNEYIVTLKVKDNEPYFLGKVKALNEETQAKITMNHKGDLNQDVVINWQGFKNINKLKISKSYTTNIKPSSDTTNYPNRKFIYALADEVMTISNSGTYILPTKEFKKKETVIGDDIYKDGVISTLSFMFSVNKTGQINPKLLADSKIEIELMYDGGDVFFK